MALLVLGTAGGLAYAAYKRKKKPQYMGKREYDLAEDWEYYPETQSQIYLQTNKKSQYIGCDEDGLIQCFDDKDDPMAAFESIPEDDDGEYVALRSRSTGLYLSIDEDGDAMGVEDECYFKIKSESNGKYSIQSEESGQWLCFDQKSMSIIGRGSRNVSTKFFIGNAFIDQSQDKWRMPVKNDILKFNSSDSVSCTRIPDGNYVVVQEDDEYDSDDDIEDEDEYEDTDDEEEKEEPDQWDVKFIKKTGEWINIFGDQVISKGHIKRWNLKIIPKFVPSTPYEPGRLMSAMESIPVVGYGAAAVHLARGRGDYAKKAAAKTTNATLVTGAVIGAVAVTVGTGGIAAGAGLAGGGLVAAGAGAGAAAGAVGGAAGVFAESQIAKTIKDDDIKDQCLSGTAKDYIQGIGKGAVKGAISGATAGLADGANDIFGDSEMYSNLKEMKELKRLKELKEAVDMPGQLAEEVVGDDPQTFGGKFAKGMIEESGGGVQDAAIDKAKGYYGKKGVRASPYPEDAIKRDVAKGKFGSKRPKDHLANVIVGIANVERLGQQNGGYWLKPVKGYGYNGKTGRRMRKKSKKKYAPKSYVYDVISVELNMESLELGFYINNEYQGMAYRVNKKKSYCLAVSLNSPYYEVQIIDEEYEEEESEEEESEEEEETESEEEEESEDF